MIVAYLRMVRKAPRLKFQRGGPVPGSFRYNSSQNYDLRNSFKSINMARSGCVFLERASPSDLSDIRYGSLII